jgi:hypothetical protein
MLVRTTIIAAFLAAGAASVGAACTTDYQKGLDDPRFGLPNALAGQKQPGPSSAATDPTSGSGSSSVECVKKGGALVDAGACTTSFKTDILGAFATAKCDQSTCHGGTSPPSEPRIDPKDGPGTWAVFAAFKMSTGKLYINPCSTVATDSALSANVNGAATGADRGTLMPLGTTGLGTDVVAKIDAWLKCGSPDN